MCEAGRQIEDESTVAHQLHNVTCEQAVWVKVAWSGHGWRVRFGRIHAQQTDKLLKALAPVLSECVGVSHNCLHRMW